MAAPLAGIPASAAQIAQQKLQEHSHQPQKAGASKFDGVLADKSQGVGKAQATQHAQAVQQVNQVSQVDKTNQVSKTNAVDAANKAEKSTLNKVSDNQVTQKAVDPVTAKTETGKVTGMISKMMGDMEKGQGVMDKLINGGLSGKNFNSSELLSLQAGMYKYTQELELTGKVVEKATSGLKDTLKTQV